MYWDTKVYDLNVEEGHLKDTKLLCPEGKPIYRKPVIGFTRPLFEYVTLSTDKEKPPA